MTGGGSSGRPAGGGGAGLPRAAAERAPVTATRERLLLSLATVAVLAGHLTLGVARDSFRTVAGDEGTYLAMTESLVRDRDLRFDDADRSRVEAAAEPGRRTLILQRTDAGIVYSKPIVYPLVAAPFLALGGEPGVVGLHLLALAAALGLAARTLRRWWGGRAAAWVLLAAVGASVVPSYVAYRMSDLLQTALVLAGLALGLERLRDGGARGRAATPGGALRAGLGGVLLGLAGLARYPNLLLPAVVVGCLLAGRRLREAAAALAGAILAVAVLSAATAGLTGAANPYKAERASFDAGTGYPVTPTSAVAEEGFGTRLATQRLAAKPIWEPRVSAWAALYYLLGRHTGLLLYFPATVVLAAAALRRPDRLAWMLLAGAAAGVLFYVVWMPRNYFGGSTFVGNRYFLTLYPLLLFAPARPPGRRGLAWPWLAGVLVWVSAAASVERAGELDRSSQSHAYAGVFRLLPYESTARTLDGWRDRYWEGTFWRFTDPWAKAGEDAFQLTPGRPSAETLLATRGPVSALRIAVRSASPELVLEVAGRVRARRWTVDTSGAGGRAVIEVPVAPARRRHPFWWAPGVPYDVRALRWRVAGGGPARVRFLGVVAPATGAGGD